MGFLLGHYHLKGGRVLPLFYPASNTYILVMRSYKVAGVRMAPNTHNYQVLGLKAILAPTKRYQSPRDTIAEAVDYLSESPLDPRHRVDKLYLSSSNLSIKLPCYPSRQDCRLRVPQVALYKGYKKLKGLYLKVLVSSLS